MDSNHNQKLSQTLEDAIAKLPTDWALTPCVGKQNIWPKWSTKALDRETLIKAVKGQINHEGNHISWTGISIVTGPLSDGLMAVDFDGVGATQKYLELSGGEQPPETLQWTSGRPGRFQILLDVPPEKRPGLKPQKFELENGDKLELRWNECSTLPPSIHPLTKRPYYWQKTDCAIAECPDFILELMRDLPAPAVELPKKSSPRNATYIGEKSLEEVLEEALCKLDAQEFYGEWTLLKADKKGDFKGVCPLHAEKSASFHVKSADKTFYCFGCSVGGGPVQFLHQIRGGSGSPIGKDFVEVVRELAEKTGVQMPEFRPKAQQLKSNFQNPKPNSQSSKPNNLLTHPKFETPDTASLESEIQKLFTLDLKRSQIQIKISELAKTYRLPGSDIWKIYREQEQEQEQEADRPDVAREIESLLSAHKGSIRLDEVLPVDLARPIEKLARMLNLRSECYLAALLTQSASLFKVGTETILRRDTNWRCVPNYNCGMVSESSQLKSPVLRAIIIHPMRELREKDRREFKQAELNYEAQLNEWKNTKKGDERSSEPKKPKMRVRIFDKATGESIVYQQAAFPDQAMMFCCDELVGMFKSANQYRGGKGSDEEDMLSFWNGTGSTVLRAEGQKASVEAVGLSVFGTIQPDVLAGLLKDCSDSNGKFARFDFVFQPLAVPNLPKDDSGRFDLTTMLADLYQRIDNLPAICFEFDKEAKEYHKAFHDACHKRRVVEPKQGLRAALGKMPEKVGKLATIIHGIKCVFNGEQVTNQIPRSAVESAVKFVKFTADQVASLYTEFSDRSALAPNLTKILLAAERKGGAIAIRDAQLAFNSKFRPTAQITKEWFLELAALGYGEIKKSGKSVIFQNTRRSDDQFLQSPSNPFPVKDTPTDPDSIVADQFLQTPLPTVTNCHQLIHEVIEAPPLQGEASRSIVGTDPLFAIPKKFPTDESVKLAENYKNLSNPQKESKEVVTVPTMGPQIQSPLSLESVGDPPTLGDSSYSDLSQDEIELLEMLQEVVEQKDPFFAKDVQLILKDACGRGIDRKKIWEAMGDASQKIFTELLAVEIAPEVMESDSLEVTIQEITDGLVAALDDGPTAVQAYVAKIDPENVEAAIALLENLKDWDAIEEIRDALS